MSNDRHEGDDLAPPSFVPADPASSIRITSGSEAAGRAPDRVICEEFLGMPMVMASPVMRALLNMVRRVGATHAPVLITGESGTGKELIARAVHHFSPRKDKPFIDLNCAALPDHLIESELFGYEKGAFSGADASKTGLFEIADGGTLFLDEIGELDNRVQAKLLRVLDGHAYFRLGGSRKVAATARVVAATNVDLDDAMETGKFRRDLFHRLEAFHLHVPPLRERLEDIPVLAYWFLRDSGLSLSGEALTILHEYSWPGNVRELRNTLGKASLAAAAEEIRAKDLPVGIVLKRRHVEDDEYSLEGLEEQTIRRVLAQTGGHQQRAADLLGISRRTLIRKLKIYRSSARSSGTRSVA